MSDPDAQPPEIPGAENCGDVFQAVARKTAAELEPDGARRQVELIVRDEDVPRLDAVEAGERTHCAAGVVHERLRLEEPDIGAGAFRELARKSRFGAEACVRGASDFV